MTLLFLAILKLFEVSLEIEFVLKFELELTKFVIVKLLELELVLEGFLIEELLVIEESLIEEE